MKIKGTKYTEEDLKESLDELSETDQKATLDCINNIESLLKDDNSS